MSLEKELLGKTNKKFCFLTSSGSAAIILALISSNIPTGSEILLPSLCCPAVLFAIQVAGFKYKLVDVDILTFNIDIKNIQKAISEKTSAIIAVHMYGIPCPIKDISLFCKKNNLILIEDSCLIFPSPENKYQVLNNNADFSIISFGYDKPIAANYGGAIFTNNSNFKKIIEQNLEENIFLNFKNDSSLKSKISKKLSKLNIENQKRIENIKFIESIINKKYLIDDKPLSKFPLWRYPIILKNIDQNNFIKELKKKDLIVTNHYQSLSKLSFSEFCPNSEYISKNIINIFIHSKVDQIDIKSKISFLNTFSD